MDLYVELAAARTGIVDEAQASLEDLHQQHYESAGELITRQRLDELFTAVVAYADAVATERLASGFDVSEVQAAFNVLETAMWRRVVATAPPEDLAESIGLVGTVFGAAKDALARGYVSLASHHHVTSLDLSALFRGVAG
jgi:hypothetical protein